MEALIVSMQSAGHKSIGEPTAPKPIGVEQGAVLVVLDVNKGVVPAALYWALTNVVGKGDTIKILGIITHTANAMGFMIRVDQSTRTVANIMELQFEVAARKEAIWKTAHVKEWCQRAGVKLEVDVKAGNNPKVIAIDEAKAMGAYHVVLDKNMKKDRKYIAENLTCFVTRWRSSGGVDVVRSFAMPMLSTSKLPPMAPAAAQPRTSAASAGSSASSTSHRGASSMSSTSFELGGDSSDDYSAQESDPASAPSTGESLGPPDSVDQPDLELSAIGTAASRPHQGANLYNLLRGPVPDQLPIIDNMNVNPLCQLIITARKRVSEDERIHSPVSDHLTPRSPLEPRTLTLKNGRRSNGSSSCIEALALNVVAPDQMGQYSKQHSMGRQSSLAVTLRTQASFSSGRKVAHSYFRPDKVSMDVHWPLMHWAESRRGAKLVVSTPRASTSLSRPTAGRKSRRARAPSGLNYSDMVDSN